MRLFFLAAALISTPALTAVPSLLNFGVGAFNICGNKASAQFQIEYRPGYRFAYVLLPLTGFMVTSRGSTYLYGGIGADFIASKKLSLFPSLSAGWYTKGNGKNLYHPLEFRTAVELAYIFDNCTRLGLQFSHISNASLGKRNPGAESLVLSYSVPLP